MTMKAKSGFCVRLDLQPGPMKGCWLVTDFRGGLSPASFHLKPGEPFTLEDCQLVIRPSVASRIHAGADKEVCAWIHCQGIRMAHSWPCGHPILFNPKESPHWHLDSFTGPVMDSQTTRFLLCSSGKVYLPLASAT